MNVHSSSTHTHERTFSHILTNAHSNSWVCLDECALFIYTYSRTRIQSHTHERTFELMSVSRWMCTLHLHILTNAHSVTYSRTHIRTHECVYMNVRSWVCRWVCVGKEEGVRREVLVGMRVRSYVWVSVRSWVCVDEGTFVSMYGWVCVREYVRMSVCSWVTCRIRSSGSTATARCRRSIVSRPFVSMWGWVCVRDSLAVCILVACHCAMQTINRI